MSIKNAFLFSLFAFSSIVLSGQDDYEITYYSDSGKAWFAKDMIRLESGEFLIMGQENWFAPPYSGIPINGEPALGNVFVLINEDGTIADTARLSNQVFFYAWDVPARFMYLKDKNEVTVPYYLRELDACGINHFNRGVASLEIKSSKIAIKDSLFISSTCERLLSVGAVITPENFLFAGRGLITMDVEEPNHTLDSIRLYNLIFYNNQTNRTDAFKIETPIFINDEELKTMILTDSSILVYGTDERTGYQAGFLEISKSGQILNFYSNPNDFSYARSILKITTTEIYAYAIIPGEGLVLIKYDHNFNEIWRSEIPAEIASYRVTAEIVPGKGILINYDKGSVALYNFDGNLVASKDYSDLGYLNKIVLLDDETFTALGTTYLNYVGSYFGEPYSYMYMLKDKISNLSPITGTAEILDGEVLVFPNPAGEKINVKMPETLERPEIVKIISGDGKLMMTEKPTTKNFVLDILKLKSGIWFMQIFLSDGSVSTSRFIKN